MRIAAKSLRQLAPTVGQVHVGALIQVGSSPAIGGGLMPGQFMRFGVLHFIANDMAWHPAFAALLEGTIFTVWSQHFVANDAGVLCLQVPAPCQLAQPVSRQPLGSSPAPRTGNAASPLVDVIGSDSLLPFLDSESDGYESSHSCGSITEVFIANGTNGTGASNTAARAAVDVLLQMPVAGDTEVERTIKASQVAVLAEREHITQEKVGLEAREHELQLALA